MIFARHVFLYVCNRKHIKSTPDPEIVAHNAFGVVTQSLEYMTSSGLCKPKSRLSRPFMDMTTCCLHNDAKTMGMLIL